jgi:ribosomal protein L7/L12
MSEKVQSIIESIKGLSLLEASQLVKGLEETFGVSAAAAAVAVAAPAAGGGRCRCTLPKPRPNFPLSLPPLVEIRLV